MDLRTEFTEKYGTGPEYIVEAPGRVNLIGEHTDYNGCPVLPMAIRYTIQAAVAAEKDKSNGTASITITNVDERYRKHTFHLEETISPFETGDWGNYVKAGIQAVLSFFLQEGRELSSFTGGKFLFYGTVPSAAGLSSSSALVVASALGFLAVNGLEMDNAVLAGVLAEGEKYVGTRGGGMDQAVSLFGKEGHAVKIDFSPFGIRPVRIPKGYTFLTADSLVKAEKTKATMDKYNSRTIECRLGVEALRRAYAAEYGERSGKGEAGQIKLLGDISARNLDLTEDDFTRFLYRTLHPEPYRVDEVSKLLGMTAGEIKGRFCLRKDGSVFPEPPAGYKIFQRVWHVLREWKRVEDSVPALESGDADSFGALMICSHVSCRDLHEISCPELDMLVSAMIKGGALGARLTGAGFGGCAVALVPDARLEDCISYIKREYYQRILNKVIDTWDSILFPCKPGAGAVVNSALDL